MSKYLIIIVAFFCSCQNAKKEATGNTVVFSKFPKQENVTLHNLIKYENGLVTRNLIKDSTIIVYDWRGTGGYFFYEYGLKSTKIINKYVPHGRSKGKALGALSIGIYNNSLWMHDIILSKIIFADLKLVSSSNGSASYKEYPFTNKYYNIQVLNNSKIIANGNYSTPNKLQEINLYTGKITADYGLLDNVPKNIPFYAWKRANESLLVSNSSAGKVVLAHLSNDNIEIFDLKTHKCIEVKGPENYKIEFKLFKSHPEQNLIQRNEKSRRAFRTVVATGNYIYALYSGENESDPNSIYGKLIYIYDWNGQPIKKIILDHYVISIAVSNDDKTLYAFDVVSSCISVAKI